MVTVCCSRRQGMYLTSAVGLVTLQPQDKSSDVKFSRLETVRQEVLIRRKSRGSATIVQYGCSASRVHPSQAASPWLYADELAKAAMFPLIKLGLWANVPERHGGEQRRVEQTQP